MVLEVGAPLESQRAVGTLERPHAGVDLGETNTPEKCFMALCFFYAKTFIHLVLNLNIARILEAIPSGGLKGAKTS